MIYMGVPRDDLLALITCGVAGDGPSRYSIDVDCEIADIVCDSGGKTQEEVQKWKHFKKYNLDNFQSGYNEQIPIDWV